VPGTGFVAVSGPGASPMQLQQSPAQSSAQYPQQQQQAAAAQRSLGDAIAAAWRTGASTVATLLPARRGYAVVSSADTDPAPAPASAPPQPQPQPAPHAMGGVEMRTMGGAATAYGGGDPASYFAKTASATPAAMPQPLQQEPSTMAVPGLVAVGGQFAGPYGYPSAPQAAAFVPRAAPAGPAPGSAAYYTYADMPGRGV